LKYIPNPRFNFEEADFGGYIFTWVNRIENYENPPLETNLTPAKILSRFPKSITNYFKGGRAGGKDCFCFLREDGSEFAIRFINNEHMDIIPYWSLFIKEDREKGQEEFIKFMDWLQQEC